MATEAKLGGRPAYGKFQPRLAASDRGGTLREAATYRILASEWPDVKLHDMVIKVKEVENNGNSGTTSSDWA
jgi:hypothetical protein